MPYIFNIYLVVCKISYAIQFYCFLFIDYVSLFIDLFIGIVVIFIPECLIPSNLFELCLSINKVLFLC